MTPTVEQTTLSSADLQQVCDLLYHETGMLFGESKRYYIARRITDRIVACGAPDCAAYLKQLHRDPAERERLINDFTVNETYFYREEHQLACLTRSLLPELVASKRPGDKIRIWSLPCSTGEEAYSIAIWLLENWRLVDAYNVEIVGSDIDTRALGAARTGVYGERALSRLSASVLQIYFETLSNHRARIITDLQESVSFTHANLIDGASLARQGCFDIIFCRNVLIYFDDASRLASIKHLYERLAPGGFLCLGHAESLGQISDRFHVRRFPEAIVYQRPADAL